MKNKKAISMHLVAWVIAILFLLLIVVAIIPHIPGQANPITETVSNFFKGVKGIFSPSAAYAATPSSGVSMEDIPKKTQIKVKNTDFGKDCEIKKIHNEEDLWVLECGWFDLNKIEKASLTFILTNIKKGEITSDNVKYWRNEKGDCSETWCWKKDGKTEPTPPNALAKILIDHLAPEEK